MMTVLVCGGRGFGVYRCALGAPVNVRLAASYRAQREQKLIHNTLYALVVELGPFKLITGGAPGADSHAHRWGQLKCFVQKVYHADWRKHGRAAGPLRNEKMLACETVDLVIAFPGGKGTADMVSRAKDHGILVREIVA